MSNDSDSHHDLIVESAEAGTRLDAFLAKHFTQFSRVKLRRVINDGGVSIDGKHPKASYRISAEQQVSIDLPAEVASDVPVPENIPLDILYEDDHMAVINKPPHMVVHPAKGNWSGTLTSALAYHFQQLSSIGGDTRPGIVHRLDRDTSGVILVAKTDAAHIGLSSQFAARTTKKEYFAIVSPAPDRDRDIINAPVGRHPYHREKMAIRSDHSTSRDAETFFEVKQRFKGFATLRILPKTGRTHQIRVHLAHAGYSVLCDTLYSGRAEIKTTDFQRNEKLDEVILSRQALHASRIKVTHPITHEPIEFTAPMPDDLLAAVAALHRYRPL